MTPSRKFDQPGMTPNDPEVGIFHHKNELTHNQHQEKCTSPFSAIIECYLHSSVVRVKPVNSLASLEV